MSFSITMVSLIATKNYRPQENPVCPIPQLQEKGKICSDGGLYPVKRPIL